MDIIIFFRILIIVIIAQRLTELFISKRNEKKSLAVGAKIMNEPVYPFMVFFHTIWLLSLAYIAFTQQLTKNDFLFYLGIGVVLVGQILRTMSMITLGHLWSTKVMFIPGKRPISSGIYKHFRHPNYFGVLIEVFFLPFMVGLWEIAIVGSIVNCTILFFRINLENKTLYQMYLEDQ